MTSNHLRQEVLLKIASNGNIKREPVAEGPTSRFGINTFDDQAMRERLPKDDYIKLRDTIKRGEKLDLNIPKTFSILDR